MKRFLLTICSIFLVCASLGPIDHAQAVTSADFRYQMLISDSAFLNVNALDAGSVQAFLESKKSWLATYVIPEYVNVPYLCRDGSGNPITEYVSVRQMREVAGGSPVPAYGMRASDLIAERAQTIGINPQVMLVLIERESSGITRSSPTSDFTRAWPIFYAFDETLATYGYSCAQARQVATDYGGAGLQFSYGTFNLKNKYNQATTWSNPITIDGTTFSPESRATKVLYIYTPHIYNGNYNFWYLFSNWFGGTPPPKYVPPLVRDSGGNVYIADTTTNKLWHIDSADTFLAFGFNWGDVTPLASSPYVLYPAAGRVSRLIRGTNGRVYYVEAAKKRVIMSPRIFDKFGFSWGAITNIPDTVISQIPVGIPLWELVRVENTGTVYLQSRGQDHALPSADVFTNIWGFAWNEVADVPSYEVFQFPVTGALSQLAMSNDGRVFVVDAGKKYYIPSANMFNAYGYKWDQVVPIESSFLDNFPSKGNLTSLLGAPDGRVFYVTGGSKRYVSGAAFSKNRFSFADVRWVGWFTLNAIPNGSAL